MKDPRDTVFGPPCYDSEELLDYALGSLEGAVREEMEVHLDRCLRCRLEAVRMRKAVDDSERSPSGKERAELEGVRVRVWNRLRRGLDEAARTESYSGGEASVEVAFDELVRHGAAGGSADPRLWEFRRKACSYVAHEYANWLGSGEGLETVGQVVARLELALRTPDAGALVGVIRTHGLTTHVVICFMLVSIAWGVPGRPRDRSEVAERIDYAVQRLRERSLFASGAIDRARAMVAEFARQYLPETILGRE